MSSSVLSTSSIDGLGLRLKAGLSVPDLQLLSRYRDEFRVPYDHVMSSARHLFQVDPSGRPAKSTSAIVEKLKRGSMRLSQMQDIAGCRIVVDRLKDQDFLIGILRSKLSCELDDRRVRPSFGYRAAHLIATVEGRLVEIQVRTRLQHSWAELSEKAADRFGPELKYGGGNPDLLNILEQTSKTLRDFEELEPRLDAILERSTPEAATLIQGFETQREKLVKNHNEMLEILRGTE